MAYQSTNPQFQTVTTTSSAPSPMSKWWPIGLFISWVIFVIIGGGLIGAWNSNVQYGSYYGEYGGHVENMSQYYGAIACFAIGGILQLTFWIVLIVWRVQRRRSPPVVSTSVIYANTPSAEAARADKISPNWQPPTEIYPAPQPTVPAPTYHTVQIPGGTTAPSAEKQTTMRYCGNCGTAITTPFCKQCGSRG